MAGYGPNWAVSHTLGRAVVVPEGFAEILLPGLTELIAQLKATHAQHLLLAGFQAMDWLRETFLQV